MKTRHKLTEIITIIVLAVIAGVEEWVEIADFGRAKEVRFSPKGAFVNAGMICPWVYPGNWTIFSENFGLLARLCYTSLARSEDRATLESDPSAEVGEQTDGQGEISSALSTSGVSVPTSPSSTASCT